MVSAAAARATGEGGQTTPATVTLDTITVQGRGTVVPTGLNLGTPSRGGSRLDLTPLETPASIEIIPGAKIRERGQNSITEAVTQNATGITSVGAPGNGGAAYTSRGFAGVNSVMNLYDGTRLYVGSGTITFPFDTWNVERIEVLRGPASVLYGEGAIGGIINVVPKKPSFDAINEVRAVLGTNGTRRLALDSGGAISDRLAYRFNISGNMTDGWLRQNGNFGNLAISGALLFQATPDLAFTLSNDFGYQEPMRYFGTPLVNGQLNRALRFNNYNVADSAIRFQDNWTQFKAEWTPNADLTIRNTAYRITSDRHWRNVESYAAIPSTGRIARSSYIEIFHRQEQIGNRADATLRGSLFGLKNELVVGFDVNRISFRNTSNSPYGGTSSVDPYAFDPGRFINLAGTRPAFQTTTDQVSVFAEDRLSVTDKLALIAGIRYEAPRIRRDDLINPANSFTKSFDAISYRFGVVYNPFPDTALYAQYATGVDPVGSLISLPVSQRNFQLSTGRQIEIGFKQAFWGGRGEFTLAGYRITKDNLLTVEPTNPAVIVQVGSQSSQGVEASLSLRLWENWRVEGNLALLRAQYDNFRQSVGGVAVSYRGNQPQNVPNQVANLWLSWAFAPRMEARAGVQYVGPTFGDFANTARRPGYALVNASIDYQVTDKSRLSLRGYNLFDQVYAVTGSSTMWLLGRPRTVELSYAVTF
ncbi:TonB-dependent receptor [Phreatobacter stygius]|uniref:TonB-dependent siderophore receptor n=1 Tax=Phreatobacter stygius TaxID=1940610 RepID=A0A4D7BIL8_9HYPH|nr:TonB-dependent siderophore receptor [Phreatobacter stygius]QCI69518.1 TonB-dependent siderophore receptor [Phreatobacter stygius]